ncbi:MAG TPA: ankyrin repeat domain-containing protein [Micromonosporaceae bacterium]|jgi:ankyrin repeat protein
MLAGSLPERPSLEQVRKQAKDLRAGVRAGHPKHIWLVRELHPRPTVTDEAARAAFTLGDAQLVIARSYGFASWRRLRAYLDVAARYGRTPYAEPTETGGPAEQFLRLACLTYGPDNDADLPHRRRRARDALAAHPELTSGNIHAAAAVGDVVAASAVLSANASLASRDGGPYDWPPLLYLALSRAHYVRPGWSTLDVARLLLAHGADPNAGYLPAGEPPPVTALSGAFHGRRDPIRQPAHRHGLALARLLLEAGADPNDAQAVSNAGGYPYDDAHFDLLFRHGLGRDSVGPWRKRIGQHPRLPGPRRLVQEELWYAAERNLPGRVRLLLHHCAVLHIDIEAVDDAGRTAHDLAMLGGNVEVADLLAAAGARTRPLDPADHVVAACLRADGPAVRRLLAADEGLAVRAIAAHPHALHQAAALDRPDAVRLLVSIGFPVNDARMSPLHTAAVCGHLDVVMMLVDLDADPMAAATDDTPGQFAPSDPTPAGWARHSGHTEVVEYLTARS